MPKDEGMIPARKRHKAAIGRLETPVVATIGVPGLSFAPPREGRGVDPMFMDAIGVGVMAVPALLPGGGFDGRFDGIINRPVA